MESLVGYGSDDESGENYQDIRKSDIGRGMDRIRQGEEDVNYDNVQMDMSEESNNNHSASSNDDDKSSTKSSSSRSSERSMDSPVGDEHDCKIDKTGNGLNIAESGRKKDEDSRHRDEERWRDKYSKVDRDRKDRPERRGGSRDLTARDYRDKDVKIRDRERGRRDERRSKSRSRERDRERRRSRSRERGNKRRSHTPDRHLGSRHRDEKRYRRSSRSRERDRERRSPGSSRPRSRSRERDRGKSSSSSSGSGRRGSYDKKPSKLTILERLGIELRPPDSAPAVTPQLLLQKSIEQQVQQVKSNTGIELPKYYNPAAMNPARYAEQMQKRKLLWGNKSQSLEGKTDEPKPTVPVSNNKWEGTTFAQDQDGKMTAKFKRLMGIKEPASTSVASSTSSGPPPNPEGNDILKKQEELFNSMEMQYEVARVATHTHRGVGLGFGTFQYPR
ncbi:hypothetical protein L9F63_017239 [Diploptera punctata]|uniref:Small acidic protein-like domain-containing protein n=1 Tax=Diploptera punctata TaxID=6984 RepID=A0AAD7ZZI8_DIPPU|nr:hypothetical protein L9F63_017239 [Diploptera punctata]